METIVVGIITAVVIVGAGVLLYHAVRDRKADEAYEASLRADLEAAVEAAALAVSKETACSLPLARVIVAKPFWDRKLV